MTVIPGFNLRARQLYPLILGVVLMALGHAAEPAPPFAMTLPSTPRFPDRDFDLRAYGGVADGHSLNTRAFARAIAACSASGGGRVVVPAGNWLTGAIQLQSHVDLQVDRGATILFSTDPADYLPVVWVRWSGFECMNYSPLIYARHCENIAVTGQGTLDGQGARWWYWNRRQSASGDRLHQMSIDHVPADRRVFGRPEDAMRPELIEPIDCRSVLIEGVKILSGPFWTLHPVYCDGFIARNLTIRTTGPNNDGIDVDSTRNVLIEGCDVSAGDDCICLKSGINEEGRRIGRPTERVVIRHCITRSGHGGFVIGSDLSGGIRDIFVDDCDFLGTDIGIRIKSARGRGAVVENIWCRDIRMRNIGGQAVHITPFYKAWLGSDQGVATTFRDFHLENIDVDGARVGLEISGLPEQPLERFSLSHAHIVAMQGLLCTDARDLVLDDIFINPHTSGTGFTLTNITGGKIAASKSAEGCDTFLIVHGAKTAGIRLIHDDFSLARTPVEFGPGVRPDAVQQEAAGGQ